MPSSVSVSETSCGGLEPCVSTGTRGVPPLSQQIAPLPLPLRVPKPLPSSPLHPTLAVWSAPPPLRLCGTNSTRGSSRWTLHLASLWGQGGGGGGFDGENKGRSLFGGDGQCFVGFNCHCLKSIQSCVFKQWYSMQCGALWGSAAEKIYFGKSACVASGAPLM